MITIYVYIRSEPQLWTVGFYDPNGKWQAESDWESPEKAAERVHFLNGGNSKIEITDEIISVSGIKKDNPDAGIYYCTICHKNPVNAEDGYDTCQECLNNRI